MTVYRSRASQPLKWIIALMVFALVMGVTFSDVYGMGRDHGGKPGDNHQHGDHHGGNPHNGGGDNGGGSGGNDNPSPTATPEPGTLVLLAGGLSALYVARRMKKDK